jgi:hypothetical protein
MFCPTCGKEVPDASTFCLHCGSQVFAPAQTRPAGRPAGPAPTTGQSVAKLFAVLGGLGALVVVVLVVALGLVQMNRSSRSDNPTVLDTVTQPVTMPHPIVNDTFTVNGLSYVYYPFSVPQRARVTGTFQARGGRNDIEVVIFDDAGFENFKNGNLAERVYYSSRGYVTTATIDKYVPPGSYFIVFNNKDALITSKTVTAKIDAEY